MLQLKRKWGDRPDGYRVTSSDPLFALIPHIMSTRNDAHVFFDHVIEIGTLEKFVRQMRRTTDMTELSTLHVIMAACVRMIGQYPCVNRFICGRRLFARNRIVIAFNIKKDMTLDAPETIIKVEFEPTDTLPQVYEKVAEAIHLNKQAENQNDADAFAKFMASCPNFLIGMAVGLLKWLDHRGWMPRAVEDFSPFHCSLYLTDVGSLGIGSVFHHLYNFGTCSMFGALGKKGRVLKKDDNGEIVYAKTLNLRFTVDERITDGFYFAYTFREFLKLLRSPELLMEAPESAPLDPGIRRGKKPEQALPEKATV